MEEKMFRLSKVIFKNFLIFKDAVYNFDDSNLYIITGNNAETTFADNISNGTGKTSFIQGIIWGLFGESFRDIINYSADKAEVYVKVVDGENTLEVHRVIAKKSTSLKVKYNSNIVNFDSLRDMQLYINKLLLNSANANTFLQIINFSNQFDTDFISLSSSKKVEFIESLLDFNTLDTIYSFIREAMKNLDLEKSKYDTQLHMLTEQKNEITAEINKSNRLENNKILQAIENEKSNIENKKAENVTLNDTIKSLSEQLTPLQDNINVMSKLIDSKNDLITELKNKGSLNISVLNELHDDTTNCPVCDSPIDPIAIKTKLNENSKQLRKDIETIMSEIKELKQKLDNLNSSFRDIKNSIDRNTYKISQNNNEIKIFEKNILKLKELLNQQKIDNDAKLLDLNKKISEISEKKSKVDEEVFVYSYLSKIFSARSFIRSELVTRYLNLLSSKVLSYLKIFDPSLNSFEISLSNKSKYTEIMIYKDGKAISNLSEGEKTQVKIAFILSFISLFFTTYKNNLLFLFFDEVFSSLDQYSMEVALQLLKSFSSSLGIQTFIISHTNLDENLIALADKNILITKYSDHSEIK